MTGSTGSDWVSELLDQEFLFVLADPLRGAATTRPRFARGRIHVLRRNLGARGTATAIGCDKPQILGGQFIFLNLLFDFSDDLSDFTGPSLFDLLFNLSAARRVLYSLPSGLSLGC